MGEMNMATESTIQVQRIGTSRMRVPIVGTAPLLVHRFSEKSKRQMLEAMQGRKSAKQPKDPAAECDAARYRFEGEGDGFPAIAFKAATIGGARFYSGVTMTALRQYLFFDGDLGVDGQKLVKINGEWSMREDVVRVGQGGTDLRYRPEYTNWSAVLDVRYVTSMLTQDSVLSLIGAGGMGVGVGEWRPEKRGDFGTYDIAGDAEIVNE
jgi:hypothetical protein